MSGIGILDQFCKKIAIKAKSTFDEWFNLITFDSYIKDYFVMNNTPPKFPVVMGTPLWKEMMLFMFAFDYSVCIQFTNLKEFINNRYF